MPDPPRSHVMKGIRQQVVVGNQFFLRIEDTRCMKGEYDIYETTHLIRMGHDVSLTQTLPLTSLLNMS